MASQKLALLLWLAASLYSGPLSAQGVNDPTGPIPQYGTRSPPPSNVTPPTPNRQRNIFSPGAPTPRVRPFHRHDRLFRGERQIDRHRGL